MSTLTGILLDVSGSMKESVGDRTNLEEQGGAWARSVFKVIDGLIKHDVPFDNYVFAIGVGSSCGEGIFDVIKTVQQFQGDEDESLYIQETTPEVVREVFRILENNGAPKLRRWVTEEIVSNSLPLNTLFLFLKQMKKDREFLRQIVYECLPRQCREVYFIENVATRITGYQASEGDIIQISQEALSLLLKDVDSESIFAVCDASDIIHGCVGERELTDDRVNQLMNAVDPFIYGRTPLYTSLNKAINLFNDRRFPGHKKLLFILSDGEPTDKGNDRQIVSNMKDRDVTVVGCFISKSTAVEPQRLYSKMQPHWSKEAKDLFGISSTVPTQLLPRTIFIKRGWHIDIKDNETKLFMQINHPDIIKDACDLARNVVCCQDSLSDILSHVSLDLYINQETSGFKAKEQEGSTCYANASAAVLHLAMKRILGRDHGYPDFYQLRKEMIDLHGHGEHGASTFAVLTSICPKYRLKCQQVDVIGAMKAVAAKRPVGAIFYLTDDEWAIFSSFYDRNPTGILTKKELDIRKRPRNPKLRGHAVVLTSYNSECLRLMNSWGMGWADTGFFRVENAQVLNLEFIDVSWTLNDLSNNEKAYFEKHGSVVADKLINQLKSLQHAKYECPLCRRESNVTEFTGTLKNVVCPRCRGTFESGETGNILALNIYLTSLSR